MRTGNLLFPSEPETYFDLCSDLISIAKAFRGKIILTVDDYKTLGWMKALKGEQSRYRTIIRTLVEKIGEIKDSKIVVEVRFVD